jgi:hypothetical protein
MLRRGTPRGAQRSAQHHGYLPLSAGHVVNLGGLIHHLVHHEGQEVTEHDVDHRAHSGHRGAHANARKSGLGNGRVDHAAGAKFFYQSRQHFEWRTGLGDVFAQDAHAGIAAHLFCEGFAHGLGKRQFPNLSFSWRHTRPAPLLRGSGRAR